MYALRQWKNVTEVVNFISLNDHYELGGKSGCSHHVRHILR
jgi:hypothetical protein